MQLAAKNGIDFLVRTQGFTQEESYQFLSMVGDFEIAEAVNMIKNVTLHLPKDLFVKTKTLCQEGIFPLKAPDIRDSGICIPQQGIILQ